MIAKVHDILSFAVKCNVGEVLFPHMAALLKELIKVCVSERESERVCFHLFLKVK